jgi:hypothetical protein
MLQQNVNLVVHYGIAIITENNYLTLGINILCWAQSCKSYDEICALLGFYATSDASLVPTFRDNLSITSSRVKQFKKNLLVLEV